MKTRPTMRNNLWPALLCILLIVALACALSGCNIENPDDVAANETDEVATNEGDEYIDTDGATDPSAEEYDKYGQAQTQEYDAEAQKDRYQTDPVPEGKPQPVEPESAKVDKSKSGTCTLYIECSTILNNMDNFNAKKMDVLPSNGVIYAKKQVTFYKGESVYDVLLRECQKNRIHMEYSWTPIYNSHYIKGINNLYEFDCGELSGWMYSVNGWFPNYGVSRYQVSEGDSLEFHYSCDLGSEFGQKWLN